MWVKTRKNLQGPFRSKQEEVAANSHLLSVFGPVQLLISTQVFFVSKSPHQLMRAF